MKPRAAASCARAFVEVAEKIAGEIKGAEWPSPKYKDDPVGFVREVLHETPLPHQILILEAARDNFKVAVRSGQKTGKTKLVIWLGLWWYCTRPKARVFMTAAIKDQVGRVLWVELKATLRAGRLAGFELQEIVPQNPATGVVAEDGREMRGFTARDVEALAGLSGDILFIVDEASHMREDTAQAIEGNCAGGGKMIWISNPTRTEGPFYEVFNNPDKAKFWVTFHLSSEDVANYQYEKGISIPGVATRVRIQEWEQEWGRESPFFIVRVLGNFLRNETGRIITLGDIELAQARWPEAPEEGRLSMGIDPAGEGDAGDEWSFYLRRGAKVIWGEAKLGMTEDAAVEHARGLLKIHRRGDEIPVVVVDSEGPIGSAFYYRMKGIGEALKRKRPADSFETWGFKSSHNAKRDPVHYEHMREELWAAGAKWLREGGAIPGDHKLATELHAPMWMGTIKGKLKVTPKKELRALLGRSTDRADGFLLSVWEPEAFAAEDVRPAVEADRAGATERNAESYGGLNPYEGGFDPYAR